MLAIIVNLAVHMSGVIEKRLATHVSAFVILYYTNKAQAEAPADKGIGVKKPLTSEITLPIVVEIIWAVQGLISFSPVNSLRVHVHYAPSIDSSQP